MDNGGEPLAEAKDSFKPLESQFRTSSDIAVIPIDSHPLPTPASKPLPGFSGLDMGKSYDGDSTLSALLV
jgi:hypothetical protein